jgi:multicomponent Na+:H+ antiporter subunit D
MMDLQYPVMIVVVPLLVSFACFAARWWRPRAGYPAALAALALCFAMALAVFRRAVSAGPLRYSLGGWPPPWGIEYRVDPLSGLMLVLVTVLGLAAAVYARRSVELELAGREDLFWCLYLLLITGILGIILTGDLFNLFVLLEVTSLASYSLVALGSPRAKLASLRYLVIGTIGASFYLIGIGYLYIKTGSLNMEDLRSLLPPLYSSRVVRAAFVFILFGFAIKMALFPLHAWQPDAYTYAPSAVSVILSSAAAKTSAYALIRVVFSVFTLEFVRQSMPVFDILCWASAVAMIAGSVFAIRQSSFKRMLAYSSVANVGYIALAVGIAPDTTRGLTPAIVHIVNHAIIKACMFMAACAFIYRYRLRDIRQFEGLGRRMPLTSFALLLAALAMIGMPPSAGFITKWYLIAAVLEAKKYHFALVILASTLLMIVYFWRLIEIIYVRPAPGPPATEALLAREAPAGMLAPSLLFGILSFAIGLMWMSGVLAPVLHEVNAALGLGVP